MNIEEGWEELFSPYKFGRKEEFTSGLKASLVRVAIAFKLEGIPTRFKEGVFIKENCFLFKFIRFKRGRSLK